MWKLLLATFSALLASILTSSMVPAPVVAAPPPRPVVLVLVDGLSWEDVEEAPELRAVFQDSAVANLSTAQITAPEDPRYGYVFLGAASRVDAAVLPQELPKDTGQIPDAFQGPAATVQPGLFGDALRENGASTAAVGERAALVVMDSEGRAPRTYPARDPASGVAAALEDGARLIAVEATSPEEAGELAAEARTLGATVAVASPNAPWGAPSLTPFALSGHDGLLYSPTTRTTGLIANSDVAPTLLRELGLDPPLSMEGRAAELRPGALDGAEHLYERLAFVEESRFEVWAITGIAVAATFILAGLFWGRRGILSAVLAAAALPAGALVAAAFPLTSVLAVAAVTLLSAVALRVLSWWISGPAGGLAGVCLIVAAVVLADAAAGGPLMRLSTLGSNPADGARFYGIGNEYAALLAGALITGLGAFVHERRLSRMTATTLLGAVGIVAMLAVGLPAMGADVGGSLSLGFGLGATIGLLRGGGIRGVAAWAAAGLLLAAALFVSSGLLFPDASHGARAAGGGGGLYEVLVRKVLLNLAHLSSPVQPVLLAVISVITYLGWRRARGTALGATILGGAITAAASGALNDSGILATIFALAYPAVAALTIMLGTNGKTTVAQK